MIEIKLPDESKMMIDSGSNGLDVAKKISEGLAKNSVAMKLNGELTDITTPITTTDSSVAIITTKNEEALEILRHTTAHVLAHAVTRLYKDVQVTIGPAIENGFYYDFYGIVVKESDLPAIESEMAKIIEADYPIVKTVVSRSEAEKVFEERGEKYKLEILRDMPEDVKEVSLYTQDDYIELCRGPHLSSTGKVGKAFGKVVDAQNCIDLHK